VFYLTFHVRPMKLRQGSARTQPKAAARHHSIPMAYNEKALFQRMADVYEYRHPCSDYVTHLCSVATSHCCVLVPGVCQLTFACDYVADINSFFVRVACPQSSSLELHAHYAFFAGKMCLWGRCDVSKGHNAVDVMRSWSRKGRMSTTL